MISGVFQMGSRERMSHFNTVTLQKEQQQLNSPAYSRIVNLLDPDSYVSFDSLVTSEPAAAGFERAQVPGDGVWTGSGTVDNRLVYLAVQDPSVLGGSMGQRHAAKIKKAIQLAQSAGVPFIGLYETGGVRIDEGLSALEAVSEILAALQSARGDVPILAGIFGPCAGSAALIAGLSDVTIMANDRGSLTVNGPGVIAALENKSVKPDDLGGFSVQGELTGLAALSTPDAKSLCQMLRQVLSYLPDTADGFMQEQISQDDPNRCDPMLDLLAEQLDNGLDIHAVIDLIVDQNTFLELYAPFAMPLVTGIARLDGRSIGVLGLAGSRLSVPMADKAANFTQFCDRMNLPLITLLDCPGFVIESAAEHGGLVSAAARLFAAGSAARNPRLSVVIGQAIGPAYTALSSRGSGTDWVLAWPTAELAPTTADTAAHILYRTELQTAADPISARAALVEQYATTVSSPFAAAAKGLVDEMIAPSATRPRLISALQLLA